MISFFFFFFVFPVSNVTLYDDLRKSTVSITKIEQVSVIVFHTCIPIIFISEHGSAN